MPHTEKYHAFISYSHHDSRWAKWVHTRLETYSIPKELRESSGVKTLRPIFRDREELPSSSNLSTELDRALCESRSLIIVCSPHSAKSEWVNEEVVRFRALGRTDKIFCLIVAGDPDPTSETFCFCDALSLGGVPLAADLRETGDGKANSILKLVAGLLGIGYDELARREFWRRRKRLIKAGAASFLLLTVFFSVAVWALIERSNAIESRNKQEETNRVLSSGMTEIAYHANYLTNDFELQALVTDVLNKSKGLLESDFEIESFSDVLSQYNLNNNRASDVILNNSQILYDPDFSTSEKELQSAQSYLDQSLRLLELASTRFADGTWKLPEDLSVDAEAYLSMLKGEALSNKGFIMLLDGEIAASEVLLRQGIRLLEEVSQHPRLEELREILHRSLFDAYSQIAHCHRLGGSRDKAIDNFSKALESGEQHLLSENRISEAFELVLFLRYLYVSKEFPEVGKTFHPRIAELQETLRNDGVLTEEIESGVSELLHEIQPGATLAK